MEEEGTLAKVLHNAASTSLPQNSDAIAMHTQRLGYTNLGEQRPTIKPYQKKRKLAMDGSAETTPVPVAAQLVHKPAKASKPRIEVRTLFGRRHWVVKDEEPELPSTATLIKEKLATGRGKKPTKGERKILERDPAIMARVEKPVFISSRSSRGLSPEQVKKSEEEHKRRLLGWRYHQAAKAFAETGIAGQRNDKKRE